MVTSEKRTLSIEARVVDLATSQFTKMAGSIRQFAGAAVPLFKATAIAFASISAAATGAFLAFRHYAEELDKIAKVSDKFGVTAESLTALRDGAQLAGLSVEDLAASMKNFEQAVSKANDGGREQIDAFRELGLEASAFRGDQLDLVEVMARVADGMQNVGSASERTALLVKLFGKSGADLAPLLRSGSDGIRKMADEARSAGAVFTREELARVEEFNDSWTKLQQTFRTLAERIVVDLAPAFTDLFSEIGEAARENVGAVRQVFISTVLTITEGLKAIELVAFGVAEGFQGLAAAFDLLVVDKNGGDSVVVAMQKRRQAIVDLYESHKKASESIDELVAKFRALDAARGRSSQPVTRLPDTVVEGPPQKKPAPPDETFAFDKFKEGMEKASHAWRDFGRAAEEAGGRIVNGVFGSLEDAIAAGISGTMQWKQAFRAFAQSTVQALSQVIAKLLVVRTLSNVLGSYVSGSAAGVGATAGADAGAGAGAGAGAAGGGGLAATLGADGATPTPRSIGGFASLNRTPSPAPAGAPQQVNVHMTFNSVDAKGAAELIMKNKSVIEGIIISAMNNKNAFRGAVKDASI